MTSPGTPMILQGQEMLETNQFSDTRPMDWSRTNSQAGTWRLYRDLIRLRRNLDGVSAGLQGDLASVYQVDNTEKLIAYSRWDSVETGDTVVVVMNFANTVRSNFTVQFPSAGTWYALFNSDSGDYGADYGSIGSAEVVASGAPVTGPVTIGPYSALVFSPTPRTGMLIREAVTSDQPDGNGDGVLDPGETIREELVLWNKSSVAVTGLVATLTALSPGVVVMQDVSDYDPLAPEGTGTNLVAYEYSLDLSQTCGNVLRFQLEMAFNGQVVTTRFNRMVGQTVSQPPLTNDFEVWTPTPIPTWDADLILALQHPDGSEVLLVNQRGSYLDDFGTGECGSAVYTVLDQSAAASIADGGAPFADSYRPEGSLDTFIGKPLNGTWRLRMTDMFSQDPGTNQCWSIQAVYEHRGCETVPYGNHVPVAHDTNFLLFSHAPTNFILPASDPDAQPLIFEAHDTAMHGIFTLHSTTSGNATYAPVYGYVGTDTMTFAVWDGYASSGVGTVSFVMPEPEDANTNSLPDEWELRYWTNLVTALPHEDSDGDGLPNIDELRANTNPRDSNSVLRLLPFERGTESLLQWRSVGGTRYRVERSSDIENGEFPEVVRPLADEVDPAAFGQASTGTFTDAFIGGTDTNDIPMRFYRIRVLNE